MLRSLAWYWRSQAALAAGAAVATAVLTGALVVGDSVRESLRDLSEQRLGGIEEVLVSPRFLREELADSLTAALQTQVGPLILLPGASRHATSGRRHQNTTVYGVDERFEAVFLNTTSTEQGLDFSRRQGQLFPSGIVNSALARELDLVIGDDLVLNLGTVSAVPREALIGRQEDSNSIESVRVTVVAILAPPTQTKTSSSTPSSPLDHFSLNLSQAPTPAVLLPLKRLQRVLDQRGRVNALVSAKSPGGALQEALEAQLSAEDLGLTVDALPNGYRLESDRLILSHVESQAIRTASEALNTQSLGTLTYLANSLVGVNGQVPYSTVATLDLANPVTQERITWLEGESDTVLGAKEILINRWAADDLNLEIGDPIILNYYEVGAHEELITRSHKFFLRGILALEGLAADRTLTPDYPGMSDAEDISGWDPPFPVDLETIRDRDEEYWDLYGAAPKAFVSPETAETLWGSRFGDLTSFRWFDSPRPAVAPEQFLERVLSNLEPSRLGLTFQPVRQQALEASAGATDFSQLFLGFSFFLILSAGLLSSLLFKLGTEQRRREVGLLLALGFPPRRVRHRFRNEGLLIGGVGVLLGTGGAVLFASLMLEGLTTRWSTAVGTSNLHLFVDPTTLLIGAAISWLLIAWTVSRSVKRLGQDSPIASLEGRDASRIFGDSRKRSPRIAWISLTLGLLCLLISIVNPSQATTLTLTGGALLLLSGIAWYSWWLGKPRVASALEGPPLVTLGMRNAERHRERSITSVALVASACFVIALVTSFRGPSHDSAETQRARTGGYALVGESTIPLSRDLDDPEVREEFSLNEKAASQPTSPDLSFSTTPFRVRPGDDTSCLNLYRPSVPRILGATQDFLDSDLFSFSAAIEDRDNPWSLLSEPLEEGVIPAIADFNSAQWILHKGLGDEILIPVEQGPPGATATRRTDRWFSFSERTGHLRRELHPTLPRTQRIQLLPHRLSLERVESVDPVGERPRAVWARSTNNQRPPRRLRRDRTHLPHHLSDLRGTRFPPRHDRPGNRNATQRHRAKTRTCGDASLRIPPQDAGFDSA